MVKNFEPQLNSQEKLNENTLMEVELPNEDLVRDGVEKRDLGDVIENEQKKSDPINEAKTELDELYKEKKPNSGIEEPKKEEKDDSRDRILEIRKITVELFKKLRENEGDSEKLSEMQKIASEYNKKMEELSRGINPELLVQTREEVVEKIAKGGREYLVVYFKSDEIPNLLGAITDGSNVIIVRDNLPPRVKEYVKKHELNHCQDKSSWADGSLIGHIINEARIEFKTAIRSPIGFLATEFFKLKSMSKKVFKIW